MPVPDQRTVSSLPCMPESKANTQSLKKTHQPTNQTTYLRQSLSKFGDLWLIRCKRIINKTVSDYCRIQFDDHFDDERFDIALRLTPTRMLQNAFFRASCNFVLVFRQIIQIYTSTYF